MRREGDDWWLEIDPAGSKNRPAYLVPLAQELVPPLERYLGYWRPQIAGLAAAASTALWLSAEGTALSDRHAHHRISRHTAAAFGQPVNPHLFRDALATTIAVHQPDKIDLPPVGWTELARQIRTGR